MAGKYDKDYQYIISKLNDAFTQYNKDRIVNSQGFDDITVEKQKLIDDIPYNEFRKIKLKIHSGVTDIDYLTENEKFMLEKSKRCRNVNYKISVWNIAGNINIKQIMKEYTNFIRDNDVFRRVYLYKDLEEPVKVTYKSKEESFPIHDIRNEDIGSQRFIIKNALAAEVRREYNIESDAALNIQGYLTEENRIFVIISIYPDLLYSAGIKEILCKIFDGMSVKSNSIHFDDLTLRKINNEFRLKSINYWKELLLPIGKPMTLPGEKINKDVLEKRLREKVFLYKELGEKFTTEITKFCKKSEISVKALFLYAWANILGKYHNEKNPVMAVVHNSESMNILPVKISRDNMYKDKLYDIDNQLEQSKKYTNCTISDVESTIGFSFAEHFRMLHNFMDFNGFDIQNENNNINMINSINTDDAGINLCISYQMFENNIMMNYISKEGILEIMLDNFHDLFVDELSMLIMSDGVKFDKKTFISVDDTDEERLYKIQIAQIALYLKNSGIFETVTVEEIMQFAELCRLRTYLLSDNIISEKRRISNVYIVGDGKLEESRMDSDGIVKSLRIVGKDNIFGIESLFEESEARSTYTVVSSHAKIVEIDKGILIEMLRKKSEGWIALLEKENIQKNKAQRLWTMT